MNTYVWEMDESASTFGAGLGNSGGSYTRDWITDGTWMDQGGSYNGSNEGPYDGTSGVIRSYQSNGTATRTDPNAIFDLSMVGSTATIRTVYHGLGSQYSTTGSGHIYQFGLTSNADYFGAPNDESLFIGADFQGYNTTTDIIDVDLALFDHNGADQAPLDGAWNINPLATVANGLTIDRIFTGTGVSHAIELVYTNLGGGQLGVGVGIMELSIDGRTPSNVVTSTNLAVQQTHVIAHAFSDLSNLRPGFGLSLNDNNVPMSGANFDWEDAYPTGFAPIPAVDVIPEPSRALLIAIGVLGLLARRRR